MTIISELAQNIEITPLRDEYLNSRNISADMLRLDKIHHVVSGNKIFKLRYYLESAVEKGISTIFTMGGPYSNHLHATAYATKQIGLKSIGLIRGKPFQYNETLRDCQKNGMELVFLEREDFDSMGNDKLRILYPESLFIPQGGYGISGALGASEIMKLPGVSEYNMIMVASGTGTTGAGLIMGAKQEQEIILISVLKNNLSIAEEVNMLLPKTQNLSKFRIESRFHLGGYAKKNKELFRSMNEFYAKFNIPTDFVYTGKLIYAFERLMAEDYFPSASKILLIHTGGLQGNRSLIKNELNFIYENYL